MLAKKIQSADRIQNENKQFVPKGTVGEPNFVFGVFSVQRTNYAMQLMLHQGLIAQLVRAYGQ